MADDALGSAAEDGELEEAAALGADGNQRGGPVASEDDDLLGGIAEAHVVGSGTARGNGGRNPLAQFPLGRFGADAGIKNAQNLQPRPKALGQASGDGDALAGQAGQIHGAEHAGERLPGGQIASFYD